MLIKVQEIIPKEYTLKFSKDTLLEMIKNNLFVSIAKEMIKKEHIQIKEEEYKDYEINSLSKCEFVRFKTEAIIISKKQFIEIGELLDEILEAKSKYEATTRAKAIINILSK